MKIMNVSCGSCAGVGYIMKYETLNLNDTAQTVHTKKTKCEICDGKGHMEYATFTLEEAKAILKHCGLSTES